MTRTRSILFLLVLFGGQTFAIQPALAEAPALQRSERVLLETMKALEMGSLGPSAARKTCRAEVAASKSVRSIREVSTGLFQVAEQDALGAFCAALVAAVESGQLTSGFIEGSMSGNDEARSLGVGRVIRALYYAHRQSAAQSAQEAPR
ncbi:hypothetical protein [Pelagibius sp.]|uniref:hypothetical protein n=1 Tax=Pelagibius sp. TaxID=1931238 RepID=UPI002633970D|nr:hypothetical protein [Pelagibius sp.]